MSFTIYTRNDPPCPYCEGAKLIFQTEGIAYKEIVIGRDIQREEFMDTYPDVRTIPLVLIQEDGLFVKVGGYQELKEYVRQKKTVQGLSI